MMAVDGQCTLTAHTHDMRDGNPVCYRSNCGVHFSSKLVDIINHGLGNADTLTKLVVQHRIHHHDEHPPFSPYGYLKIETHFDPLDGGWITVDCEGH